ncbi:MAG: hypothetical protein HGA45_38270, partial [Chloroflexales bacterium]|nr:hypothetical protein [Chloroflexales bacterium]
VHPLDAIRLGRRIPAPTLGLGWHPARLVANAFGAPVPGHVLELLRDGRLGDVSKAGSLGLPVRTSRDTLIDLFEWPTVTHSVPSAMGSGARGAA